MKFRSRSKPFANSVNAILTGSQVAGIRTFGVSGDEVGHDRDILGVTFGGSPQMQTKNNDHDENTIS